MMKQVISTPCFEEKPAAAAEQVWRARGCNLAPNGGVMRAAVCGFPSFPSFWDVDAVDATASALCRVTHFDARCVASCACVSVAVAGLLQGLAPEEAAQVALERGRRHLDDEDVLAEFDWYTSPDRALDELELDEPRTIGFTLKTLGCGMWALRSGRDFRQAMTDVIRSGGDADTNAAVAGALLGAAVGFAGLPESWISGMPYTSWLSAWSLKPMFVLGLQGAQTGASEARGNSSS